MDIRKRSIEVILENQHEGGAYIASPTFPTYHYCWLRDGSFIAHSMEIAGEFESAEKFYRWVGNAINRYSGKVAVLEEQLKNGKVPDQRGILNTRFSLEGIEESSNSAWGNFQIDGYGTWLWALSEHVRLTGDISLLKELFNPIQTTLHYLELTWKLPNYDCWEEYPEYLHPSSLAAVFAGFDSILSLMRAGKMDFVSVDVERLAGQVKDFITKYATYNRRLVKHIFPEKSHMSPYPVKESGVDSSLIAFTIPFNVMPPEHTIMQSTMQAIEADLHRPGGGVYRYKADVYYGGGEWLLLTAWLGWYYTQIGKNDKAKSLRAWIESQADADGCLAEQVSDHTLSPNHFEPWVKQWGQVANPLLWSHAMYIILDSAIKDGTSK